MADTFKYKAPEAALVSADRWYAITPNDSTDLAITPRAVLCTADGNLAAIDAMGVTMTVALVAGQLLPIRPTRVGTASTGTFYALY